MREKIKATSNRTWGTMKRGSSELSRMAAELRVSYGNLQEKDQSLRAKSLTFSAAFLIVLLAAAMVCGCRRGGTDAQTADSSSNASSSPRRPPPQTEFERDLEYVRLGHFKYIYVISRPDGAALTNDDITYLTENTPKETNQRVATEGRRRVIVGTNFVFTPENLDALRKRFTVEDYSGK
jgi:hypothetical protein